jgi:hypothetical protein
MKKKYPNFQMGDIGAGRAAGRSLAVEYFYYKTK